MEWYYTKAGNQAGPVSLDELIHKISVGEVSSNQMVWHEGMADWQPISNVPELQITATSGQAAPPTLPAQAVLHWSDSTVSVHPSAEVAIISTL